MIRTPQQMAQRLKAEPPHSEPDLYAAGYWRSAYEALHAEHLKLQGQYNALFCGACEHLLTRVGEACEHCGHDAALGDDCPCDHCHERLAEHAADIEAAGGRQEPKGWMP